MVRLPGRSSISVTTDLTKEQFMEQGETPNLVGLVTFLTTVVARKLA